MPEEKSCGNKNKESDLEAIEQEKCKLERSFSYDVSSKQKQNKIFLLVFFPSTAKFLLFVRCNF